MSPALVLVLLAGGGGLAHAQSVPDAERAFETAQERLAAFEYAEAIALLEDLVAREPAPAVELRARALIVRAQASRGDTDGARAAAEALYARDPGVELDLGDAVSPRIRSFFVEAQRSARAAPAQEAAVRVRASDDRIRVRTSASTSALIDRVVVHVLQGADFEAYEASPSDGGGYSLVRPWAPALRYYVRFLAPSGHVVAEAGSPEVPLSWTDTARADASTEPAVDLSGSQPSEGRSHTGLIVGISAAVLAVAAAVVLAVWRPWSDRPSLDRGVMLP